MKEELKTELIGFFMDGVFPITFVLLFFCGLFLVLYLLYRVGKKIFSYRHSIKFFITDLWNISTKHRSGKVVYVTVEQYAAFNMVNSYRYPLNSYTVRKNVVEEISSIFFNPVQYLKFVRYCKRVKKRENLAHATNELSEITDKLSEFIKKQNEENVSNIKDCLESMKNMKP